MIVNYLCWSTFISLLAILLLYPLRHHAHGVRFTRASAAIFLFPSLTSAIISQILILRKEVIFISLARIPIVKIQFGFQLTEDNILIIIAINLLIAVLIFTLSSRNLVNYCSVASLSCLFIFIVAATPDQLVRISAFSIGTIVLTAVLIADEVDETVINVLSRDFIINRVSDFFAFTALVQMLLQFNFFITNEIDAQANNIEFIHNFLFFASVALRLMSLCRTNKFAAPMSTTAFKLIVFYRLLLGAGSELLLLFYATFTQQDTKQFTIFLIITVALLIYAIFCALSGNEKASSINNIANTVFVANLFLILYGYKIMATAIICLLIMFYPTASLAFASHGIASRAPLLRLNLIFMRYTNFLALPCRKTAVLLATIFINFINVIYAGFILYRLPQFLLAGLQMPLRFLNNGSIQRSLIFVVIILLAYSYWWGET